MKLLEIYRCLGDETRLRILHLLAQGPLCVCHFQAILGAPQVAISKHLAYLRKHGLVRARRHEQWMIYHLPEPCPTELGRQLEGLCDCAQFYPTLQRDLKRLKGIQGECGWIAKTARGDANKALKTLIR
jgi:ArsR family transcriptional regulator, arsenate/arsenite/antimonite-responsive transcriptional repressor